MIPIQGGTFEMGDTFGDSGGRDDTLYSELPVHVVKVYTFFLQRTPVTQSQWKSILGEKRNASQFRGDELPVDSVDFEDAIDFINKLNEISEQLFFRLPSEAEWEFAAREGGKYVRFGNGKNIADFTEMNYDSSCTSLPTYGVRKWLGYNKTLPVKTFAPNSLGLYDMCGNILQICSDSKHDTYHGAPNDSKPWIDPDSNRGVSRGGYWNANPDACRATSRSFYWRTKNGFQAYGLRLAANEI